VVRRVDPAGTAGGAGSGRTARVASPARLVLALSVAAVLAIFLLYTSIAGGGNPSIQPSALKDRTGKVQLAGRVFGPVTGDAQARGLRFQLRDIDGNRSSAVRVLYRGSVPDLFRAGRDIVVDGRLRNGTFVADPGSMITKCPSKYSPKKSGGSA
jgi:cytochrome c-type biogenesis protein CcmE